MCFDASFNICKECKICPQLLLLLNFFKVLYMNKGLVLQFNE